MTPVEDQLKKDQCLLVEGILTVFGSDGSGWGQGTLFRDGTDAPVTLSPAQLAETHPAKMCLLGAAQFVGIQLWGIKPIANPYGGPLDAIRYGGTREWDESRSGAHLLTSLWDAEGGEAIIAFNDDEGRTWPEVQERLITLKEKVCATQVADSSAEEVAVGSA